MPPADPPLEGNSTASRAYRKRLMGGITDRKIFELERVRRRSWELMARFSYRIPIDGAGAGSIGPDAAGRQSQVARLGKHWFHRARRRPKGRPVACDVSLASNGASWRCRLFPCVSNLAGVSSIILAYGRCIITPTKRRMKHVTDEGGVNTFPVFSTITDVGPCCIHCIMRCSSVRLATKL